MWDQLAKAWQSLLSANWWWVLAAVVAAMASMHSFAQIQRTLLRSAGVHVKQWRSEAAFYAGNALSHDDARRPGAVGDVRLPPAADLGRLAGGRVLAAGDVGRAAGRRPGAARPRRRLPARRQQEPAVADLHARRVRRAAGAGAVRRVATRSRSTASACGCCRGSTRCAASPPTPVWTSGARSSASWSRCSLSRRDARRRRSAGRCSTGSPTSPAWRSPRYAAGGNPSLAGLTVAYAAARAVGSIPLMPGGLLVVEAVLVPGLVSSGMTLAVGDLGDADLPAGQLDLHLGDRLGGVLLHVPHREGRRPRRRRSTDRRRPTTPHRSSAPTPRPRHEPERRRQRSAKSRWIAACTASARHRRSRCGRPC